MLVVGIASSEDCLLHRLYEIMLVPSSGGKRLSKQVQWWTSFNRPSCYLALGEMTEFPPRWFRVNPVDPCRPLIGLNRQCNGLYNALISCPLNMDVSHTLLNDSSIKNQKHNPPNILCCCGLTEYELLRKSSSAKTAEKTHKLVRCEIWCMRWGFFILLHLT